VWPTLRPPTLKYAFPFSSLSVHPIPYDSLSFSLSLASLRMRITIRVSAGIEGGDSRGVVGEIDHKLGGGRACHAASMQPYTVECEESYRVALKSNNASRHQAQLTKQSTELRHMRFYRDWCVLSRSLAIFPSHLRISFWSTYTAFKLYHMVCSFTRVGEGGSDLDRTEQQMLQFLTEHIVLHTST
jgi:hypothetical protein